ncbi:MAG: M23 family metallopeptidase [Gilvibacter sp.]
MNLSCKTGDDFASDGVTTEVNLSVGCEDAYYPPWQISPYALPYPVGKSYSIGLSNCGGGTHSEGQPDQFAINIIMPIGSTVTASRHGTVMFVEESGLNYEDTNNMVIVRDEDGFFIQYQHLAPDGALVEVGDFVSYGQPIALSGASGLANSAYLHLVVTRFGDWRFPYRRSYPITFFNTSPNPHSLIQGETYEALSY